MTTPPTIQTLPLEVIKLIAAGEVIDSWVAVVRELVENALDAQADRIVIQLQPETLSVRVVDNGQGMGQEDLRLCLRPHTTSKIRSREDLWQLSSFGFRGEALHSLTQVADVTVMSCGDQGVGWSVGTRDGIWEDRGVVAIAPGTVVAVDRLFENLPVRRQGLPPLSQQLKEIQQLIGDFALCNPWVLWRVEKDRRLWWQVSPSTTAREILPQLLPRIQPQDLQCLPDRPLAYPVVAEGLAGKPWRPARLRGVWGLPDRCHRHRADCLRFGVNGRMVRSPAMEKAMGESFARTLPIHRYPVIFAHLQIDPRFVDWNRHPAKTEIYLHHGEHWQTQLQRAIAEGLKFAGQAPAPLDYGRFQKLIQVAEANGHYQLPSIPTVGDRSDPIASPSHPNPPAPLFPLKALAQVRQTYIVAETAEGLWLVEQHIAHERVIYEKLVADWQLVPLTPPLLLKNLRPPQVAQLQRIGIQVEDFGDRLWKISTIPQRLHQTPDPEGVILELSQGGDLNAAQVATACRSAIRNGTPLSLGEMQDLLNQWQRTQNPRTCPHGRPIYLALEESSLARYFRRHWVIGKSHGLE